MRSTITLQYVRLDLVVHSCCALDPAAAAAAAAGAAAAAAVLMWVPLPYRLSDSKCFTAGSGWCIGQQTGGPGSFSVWRQGLERVAHRKI